MADFVSHGGTHERKPDSVVAISYWRIPGGSGYDSAEPRLVYFSDCEIAQALAERYCDPPEMAFVVSVAALDRFPKPEQLETSNHGDNLLRGE